MKPQRNSTHKRIEKIMAAKSNSPLNSDSRNSRVKKTINELEAGDYFRGTVKILRKAKPGPLILSVFDGTGTITAVAHDRIFEDIMPLPDKENVYNLGNVIIKDNRNKNQKKKSSSTNKDSNSTSGSPSGTNADATDKAQLLTPDDLNVDDTVKIFGKVGIHRNNLEIEIKSIRSSSLDFTDIINTHTLPVREGFSIQSERYESMRSTFVKIAQRIRLAIIEQQPILIRHHNDADGICAGLVIEHSIRNIMKRRNIKPKNLIYRSPSISPFYDQIDMFRDISKFNKYTDLFGDKSPLVLLLDTGSTPENLFALQVVNSVQFDCIIVDHHNPGKITDGKSQICHLLQFHLNPYLFGWDSQTCGGMLCYELARFVDEDLDDPYLFPAVAAVADRCDIPEVDLYVENSMKTKEELLEIALVIDYLAFNFRFDGGDGLYDRVFTNEHLVQLIAKEVHHLFDTSFNRILPTVSSTNLNGVLYTEVDLEKNTKRRQYPTPGKILGKIHDYLATQNKGLIVFTGGIFSDGIIIRATEPVLPVPDLLIALQKSFPEANVDGGGHEQAGSLKYLPAFSEKIREYIQNCIADR
ncbi:MAG: DHH family phosphoesterase [Promethearchaeota archaeon]